jgi:predicted RNase H-like nuclease
MCAPVDRRHARPARATVVAVDCRVLGVDACKRGWVGVVLGSEAPEAFFAGDFANLVTLADAGGPLAAVAVDMPIGLTDRGRRQADALARRLVGRRSSSVFTTPVRSALEADTYARAAVLNRRHAGEGLSAQAFALRRKVLELERWMRESDRTAIEVHPELSFAVLAGAPLHDPKSTWAGAKVREGLLADAGISLPADLGVAGHNAAVDDVLDAAIAAWSARRYANGEATSVPNPPEILADGYPCAIWA